MSAPTTSRRVTPTGIRLLPADVDRDTWLAERRKGIGSSDVPAILGLVNRRTPLHVWHDKRGALPDQQTEEMLWGALLEEPVAREWARRNRSVIARVGLVANVDEPWQMATLDRRVAECPLNRREREACALEVKCRNAHQTHRWRSDVPDDVLAQTVWQMHVTGYDHVHVAVLVGGNTYHQTVVRRDDQVTDYVLGEVGKFRQHMLTGQPPAPDMDKPDALNELDALLNPDRVGQITIDGVDDVIEYVRASEAKSAAERELKAARAKLAQHANGARYVLWGDNDLVYEFAPVTRSTCDLAALAERWPEAYADTVTDKTHYSIRVDRAFRGKGLQ